MLIKIGFERNFFEGKKRFEFLVLKRGFLQSNRGYLRYLGRLRCPIWLGKMEFNPSLDVQEVYLNPSGEDAIFLLWIYIGLPNANTKSFFS